MKQGFTLIELLVVILIIGILAAVAVPQYQKAVEKSKTAEAITQVRALAEAEKIYFLANGKYTDSFEELDIQISGTFVENELYKLNQHNWRFSLNAVNTLYPRIWARNKTGYGEQWYINYYLSTGELECVAVPNDKKGQDICKTFGVSRPCPHNQKDRICYTIH